MKEFIVITILSLSYILTAIVIVISILILIQDVKERRASKRPVQFRITNEVDYLLSRGVKIFIPPANMKKYMGPKDQDDDDDALD